MRIAVYMRCSTGEQTVDSQRTEIERYLTSRQAEKVTWFDDSGYSGSRADRPAYQKMLTDIRRRRFDLLVSFRLDRLSRSLIDAVHLLDELRRHDVKLVTLRDGISFEGPYGNVLFALISALAEIEAQAIRERVRAGIANARRRGVRLGRPSSDIDIREVKRMRSAGRTMSEIAGHFDVTVRTLQRRLNGHDKNP